MAVSLTGTDIHLAFGTNKVLRGVNIHVDAGRTTTVIGPSGSGKSTLLRALNRLHEPDEGDILLGGKSVLRDNPDELRQRIGMVFQHFNLFPHKTVADNVALAPQKLKGLTKEAARAAAMEQLELVGLSAKADSRPGNLSGGQQQRVAIQPDRGCGIDDMRAVGRVAQHDLRQAVLARAGQFGPAPRDRGWHRRLGFGPCGRRSVETGPSIRT